MDERDYIPRDEAHQLVRDVGDSMRREFTAALSTVQVQIGASEKILGERIKSAVKISAVVVGIGQIAAAIIAIKLGQSPAVVTNALSWLVGL